MHLSVGKRKVTNRPWFTLENCLYECVYDCSQLQTAVHNAVYIRQNNSELLF